MINNKKIVVVMPAYNAARTLEMTWEALPHDIVDEVILVDDGSVDDTVDRARGLPISMTLRHEHNRGYGANQKTCYQAALKLGADVVIMLHPDYQYDPRLVRAMASMIAEGVYDSVIASRILGTGALAGGMPLYKYIANRVLTSFQNILLPYKLSEYHSGYRAFSREILETLPLDQNSDDFIFDNQMLLQIIGSGYRIGEVSCPTRYMEESSSISVSRAVTYGVAVLLTTFEYRISRWGLLRSRRFPRPSQ